MERKRIVTRKGDVFCVEVDNKYKVYFQYIGNDIEQLNSSVIRVFKKHYGMEDMPSMEEIVQNEIYFHAHTVLKFGIECGAWYKVGKNADVGSEKDVHFRMFNELNYSEMTKSYNWYIWTMNSPYEFIGEMKEKYLNYDMGFVYPYIEIDERIKKGKYPSKQLD